MLDRLSEELGDLDPITADQLGAPRPEGGREFSETGPGLSSQTAVHLDRGEEAPRPPDADG